MIDPVSSSFSPYNLLRPGGVSDLDAAVRAPDGMTPAGETGAVSPGSKSTTSFSNLVGKLVTSVDEKSKVAEGEVRRLMVGESDNIHRTMIAMQESGLAFNLLVEVRNKLVESYQELMRMPV